MIVTPCVSPFAVASIVSVLPPVMKNAEGPNSVLPALRSFLYSVRLIVCPSSVGANSMMSPEAAWLMAPRSVRQLLLVQSSMASQLASPLVVTVKVTAAAGSAATDSPKEVA